MPTSDPAPSHLGALGPSKRSISQQRENITSVATPWLAVGTVVWRLSWLCKTEKPALRHKARAGTLTIGVKSVVLWHARLHLPNNSDAGKHVNSGRVTRQTQKAHDAARAPARKAHRGRWHVCVAWAEWMRRCRRTGHAGVTRAAASSTVGPQVVAHLRPSKWEPWVSAGAPACRSQICAWPQMRERPCEIFIGG